ncbi:MAG: RNA polymerase factor sigma-54 [Clostridium sp.]|nr:RNA polymerase factor sigma-54 [Prevotella sp.]MCM1428997.1 RNA polymerase factor sigma-54 [Clostridium sp.]MCM1475473.1 RNA polymerase factor sigma-54 [Muribaculaceae bacterium]
METDSSKYSAGLQLEQRQRLRLSQQHLRYVKMLELNAPEFDEVVERELDDNPALESKEEETPPESVQDETPYYLRYTRNESADEATTEIVAVDDSDTLYDNLIRQISERNVSPEIARIARYLAGNVDSNGYIRRDLVNIVDDMEFNHGIVTDIETARKALDLIRSLDPPGVGARDLRDTLILQLERMPAGETRDDALRILENKFEEFTMRHYQKLISSLGLTRERTMEAVALIRTLNPKPGASFGGSSESLGNVIIPDFIVENRDGQLNITLNNRVPMLGIEQSFEEAVAALKRDAPGRRKRKGSEYIISRYNEARDFIKIIRQRQQTMMQVMTAILQIQYDYFITEDIDRLHPMMIKDIANITGLDISTISRATANKYVATPWGVFPLRYFFSDTIGNEDEGLTNRKIEAEIKSLVDSEDKRNPLSDEKICRALNDKGFDVSRRTIAKYRDRTGIPVARLRKEFQ